MPRTPAPQIALSVIVPTRNEAPNIKPLFDRLSAALAQSEFEICFVDDSDDPTSTILAELEEREPSVNCRFRRGAERDGGLSTAVTDGLRMATGRFVCVMDGDLQHPPETIPSMLAAALAGADLVVASRYAGGGSRGGLDGLGRRVVSSLARGLAKLVFSEARRSSDPLSGFFLCRRELIDGIEFRPVGFKILLELLICVPGLTVADVPLDFAPRAGGTSKATLSQGWLFLEHLASLFFHVRGSARLWKFGIIGLSGLAIFLPLLALLSNQLNMSAAYAFWPAYLPSLAWNSVCNRLWTYADRRNAILPREARTYAISALGSGVVMYALYLVLTSRGVPALGAGAIAAVGTMYLNGAINWNQVRQQPNIWTRVSTDRDIQSTLARLAKTVGAQRAYVLPLDSRRVPSAFSADLLNRVRQLRRAVMLTEANSHRAQRRTNIDVTSTLVVPVVNGGKVFGFVVCERSAPTPFSPAALERATRGVESMVPALVTAAGIRAARLSERIALADQKLPATGDAQT